MAPEHIRTTLAAHQAGILSLIDATLAITDGPAEAVQPIVANARWTMVRLLQAYQIFLHAEIYDPTVRAGSGEDIRIARDLKVDCIAIGEVFRTHTRRWSGVSTLSLWDEYLPAMRAMAGQLRSHIVSEGKAIDRLLGKPAAPAPRHAAFVVPRAGAAAPTRLGAAA